MLKELPLFLGSWLVGLFMILLPSTIVQIFGKETEEDKE